MALLLVLVEVNVEGADRSFCLSNLVYIFNSALQRNSRNLCAPSLWRAWKLDLYMRDHDLVISFHVIVEAGTVFLPRWLESSGASALVGTRLAQSLTEQINYSPRGFWARFLLHSTANVLWAAENGNEGSFLFLVGVESIKCSLENRSGCRRPEECFPVIGDDFWNPVKLSNSIKKQFRRCPSPKQQRRRV